MAFVALTPLLLALRGASAGTCLGLGALWGVLTAHALGVWFPGSVATFFGQPLWFGWVALAATAIAMVAPYTALFAWCVHVLDERRAGAWWMAFGVGAAWTVSEFLRGRLLSVGGDALANPWGLSGYALLDVTPLAPIASVAGIYALGFATAACSGGLAAAFLDPDGRASRARRVALGVSAPLGAWLVGLGVPAPGAAGEPVEIAVVQGNVSIGAQWNSELHGMTLDRHLRLSAEGVREGARLVVWPESAMTFFVADEALYRDAIGRALGDAELVAGGPARAPEAGGERYHNSVWSIASDGRILARYDKQHLVPFAETQPRWADRAQNRSFGGVRRYTPGTGPGLLATRAGLGGIVVCNEAMLPEVAGARTAAGAELLINPTNDTWIAHPQYTEQQFLIARARALEQGRFLVRASTGGPSGVVDPQGRVRARIEAGRAGIVRAAVAPIRSRTVYSRTGDWFPVVCGLGLVAARWSRGRGVGTAE